MGWPALEVCPTLRLVLGEDKADSARSPTSSTALLDSLGPGFLGLRSDRMELAPDFPGAFWL